MRLMNLPCTPALSFFGRILLAALLAGATTEARRGQEPPGQPGTLQLSPSRLSFISGPGARTLPPQEVAVGAASPTGWTATPSASWLLVSPREGVTPASFSVRVSASDLQPGEYSARVAVQAVGRTTAFLGVRVTIAESRPRATAEPKLVVTPGQVAFSCPLGQPAPLFFSVRVQAEGGARLPWTAAVDQPWLSVAPGQGTTPAEVRLTAVPGALTAGSYEAALLVRVGRPSDAAPAATVVKVPVRFTIEATGGQLAFASPILPTAAVNVPYSQAIPIRGGRPPYFFQVVQGQVPPEIAVLNGALAGVPRSSGTFAFTIAVTDSARPPATALQTFMMTVTVIDQNTALVVRPQEIALTSAKGQVPAPVTLTVGSGGPPLSWRVSTDVGWLNTQPATGVAPASVTLTADTKTLAPGAYSAVLTVAMEAAPNSPVQIPVKLIVK